VLVLANEREKAQRDVLTYAAWGDGLTPQGYLTREMRLRRTIYARRGMHTWLWTDKSGGILSSCETYRMASNHKGKPGHVYGIASVFTEEKLRGQGHAARLLEKLLEHLPRLDAQAQAAILYSEIGENFYLKSGFSKIVCEDWIWDAKDQALEQGNLELLDESQVHQALPQKPAGALQVFPTSEQIDWQLERERIYSLQLGRVRPSIHGARNKEGRAIWRAQFRTNELGILALEAETFEAAAMLIECARAVAARAGLKTVRWWKTPLAFDLTPPDEVRVEMREDRDLPMIRPIKKDIAPEDWQTVYRALWV